MFKIHNSHFSCQVFTYSWSISTTSFLVTARSSLSAKSIDPIKVIIPQLRILDAASPGGSILGSTSSYAVFSWQVGTTVLRRDWGGATSRSTGWKRSGYQETKSNRQTEVEKRIVPGRRWKSEVVRKSVRHCYTGSFKHSTDVHLRLAHSRQTPNSIWPPQILGH